MVMNNILGAAKNIVPAFTVIFLLAFLDLASAANEIQFAKDDRVDGRAVVFDI